MERWVVARTQGTALAAGESMHFSYVLKYESCLVRTVSLTCMLSGWRYLSAFRSWPFPGQNVEEHSERNHSREAAVGQSGLGPDP